jgi:hypothetical protein
MGQRFCEDDEQEEVQDNRLRFIEDLNFWEDAPSPALGYNDELMEYR